MVVNCAEEFRTADYHTLVDSVMLVHETVQALVKKATKMDKMPKIVDINQRMKEELTRLREEKPAKKKKAKGKVKVPPKEGKKKLKAPATAAVEIKLKPEALQEGTESQTGSRLILVPGPNAADKADVLAERLKQSVAAFVEVGRPEKCTNLRIAGLDETVAETEVLAAIAMKWSSDSRRATTELQEAGPSNPDTNPITTSLQSTSETFEQPQLKQVRVVGIDDSISADEVCQALAQVGGCPAYQIKVSKLHTGARGTGMESQPSTSKDLTGMEEASRENTERKERKRKRARSSSSDSSSSSSTSSSSSLGCRRKKNRKHSRRNRKFDYLINEIHNLKSQLNKSCFESPLTDNNEYAESCIDSNISGDLFEQTEASQPDGSTESNTDFNITLVTKLKEPSVPKASREHLEQLKELQHFDSPEWNNVRYAELQKQYAHSPGFVELDPNDEIKQFDSSKFCINMEKAFAAVTSSLLKQKDVLESEIRKFLMWAYSEKDISYNEIYLKLNEVFTNSDYTKVCSDSLQLVCGHRAELVQHRRETILASVKDAYHKSALRKIPPSCSNLFDSEKFSTAIEKAGGMKNVFCLQVHEILSALECEEYDNYTENIIYVEPPIEHTDQVTDEDSDKSDEEHGANLNHLGRRLLQTS
ncbi:unnamed protein product [Chilo suppressalis]|uniref:Uncharacterized protein n=1 Tax=Chilo suppressalis TaxID=168631 RepID=A0ABN8B964_CHISP|nr:unnamed protein product [Chilo suppressalis]